MHSSRKWLKWVGRLIVAVIIGWLIFLVGLVVAIHHAGNSDSVENADVIIVLGAGLNRNGSVGRALWRRSSHAADLWHEGYANTIICTGGQSPRQNRSEADGCQEVLMREGVPESAIILENQSRSTEENALYSRDIMDNHRWETAILVSDSFHMLRAQLIFTTRGHEVVLSPVSSSRLRKSYYAGMLFREVIGLHWQVFKDVLNLPITYVP